MDSPPRPGPASGPFGPNGAPAPFGDPQAWLRGFMSTLGAQMPAHGALPPGLPALDPASAFRIDPAKLLELQNTYTRNFGELWQAWGAGHRGGAKDKRFSADTWTGPHAFFADLYLLNARYLYELADAIEADSKSRAKIRFAVQQWIDAMAPSNFLALNPDALQKIVDTKGESLKNGISLFLADAMKGRISMTDESAFEIGRNVATSEGQVVFENEIFQLIQYKALTDTVFEKPLLIVPPCINKFYILDLQPENSLVRNAVAEGHTTFLVSWRNPTMEQAALTWDDYIADGVIRAIDVVREIAKQKTIDVLGFCVGGTMVATALAVCAAKPERKKRGDDAQPAASLTLLTTLLDFSDTVFVDEESVRKRETTIGGCIVGGIKGAVGLMPARDLATSFSFLRPNELVWNYVVSNYLKGEPPPAFDLLYWNADSTNLPGPFFAWYLRNTYLENKLMVPGALTVCGVKVDLGKIASPVFIYGSRDDHIVPWPAAYASTQLLKGPKRFVLGASGHIAGVINPPAKKKRSHWTYQPARGHFPAEPDAWFAKAKEVPGSWWTEWHDWLATFAGKKVKARATYGNTKYEPIEPAPGRYVAVRAT
jgi:polyhydroxyalkanoate synthase